MYIKIFFNARPLFLCDLIDETIKPLLQRDDVIFMEEMKSDTVKTMIRKMEQSDPYAGVFYHPDLQELKNIFEKNFNIIQAGGGLVKNEQGEILMIFRRGKWDLPKGKLDAGETLEQCALREVMEETGIKDLVPGSFLTVTRHVYQEKQQSVLKESHWFTMHASAGQQLTPQSEEDIFDIQWVRANQIADYLAKSFVLIADIMQAAKEKSFIYF